VSLIPGVIASGISGHLVNNNYFSIATQTVTGSSVLAVTFSSIPSTYTHLQLRWVGRTTRSTTSDSLYVQLNGDTSYYYSHGLSGNGSSASAYADNTNPNNLGLATASSATSGMFSAGVTDILDYTNTNKYKTLRNFSGFDENGSGAIRLSSSANIGTSAAINSIYIYTNGGGNIDVGSQFALYGIK